MKKPEAAFQDKVLKQLRKQGGWWTKLHDLSTIGLPDIIGLYKGDFYALELKVDAPTKKIQVHTLKKISRNGGNSFIVRPANFDDVIFKIFTGHYPPS